MEPNAALFLDFKNKQLLVPDNKEVISVSENDDIFLSCGKGNQIHLEKKIDENPDVKLDYSVTLTCINSKFKLKITNSRDDDLNIYKILCASKPKFTLEPEYKRICSEENCARLMKNKVLIKEVDERKDLELYEIYVNSITKLTRYSKMTVSSGKSGVTNYESGKFDTTAADELLDIDNLPDLDTTGTNLSKHDLIYETQKKSFENQLNVCKNHQQNQCPFLEPKKYFVKSTLSPAPSFLYSIQMNASDIYMNVRPQYYEINTGNWRIIEKAIVKKAQEEMNDFVVYTGVAEIFKINDTLENGENEEKELFLYARKAANGTLIKKISIPDYFWKIVINNKNNADYNEAVVFITFNNPFINESYVDRRMRYICQQPLEVCKPKNRNNKKERLDPENFKLGYTIMCSAIDFLKSSSIIVDGLDLKSVYKSMKFKNFQKGGDCSL